MKICLVMSSLVYLESDKKSAYSLICSLFLNDLEDAFITNGIEGIDIGLIKVFILLYADDIVMLIFS